MLRPCRTTPCTAVSRTQIGIIPQSRSGLYCCSDLIVIVTCFRQSSPLTSVKLTVPIKNTVLYTLQYEVGI